MVRRWLVVIVMVVVLTVVLGGYKAWQIRQAIAFGESFPEQTEAVRAVVVREKEWTPRVSTVATVVAPSSLILINELPGRVTALGFAAGDAVEKGQVLVRLDSRQERAELRAVRARAELARTQLARLEKLLARDAASQSAVDIAQANLSVALADALSLEAIIDKQTLRAPFAARAGLHTLAVGQYLAANTRITELVGTEDVVWLDFDLPQQQTGVSIGASVTITAPRLLDEPVTAIVIARGAALSKASRNRSFRARLDGYREQLVPSTLVRVSAPTAEPRQVAVVPAAAVRRSGFAAHVYVIAEHREEGQNIYRAERRVVELGDQRDEEIVLRGGVRVGERIAASGSFKLRDGMRLSLAPDSDREPESVSVGP